MLTCSDRIDVFCCGLRRFQVNALQHVTEATGGSLLLLPSFASPLDHSLCSALGRFVGHHAVLRVHTSQPLQIAHLVGAVGAPQEKRTSSDACVVHDIPLRAVSEAQGVAVLCELRDDVLAAQLYVQASLSYELPSGQRLTRTVTQQLQVTGNKAVFLESVEADTQAVLIAKRLVSAARDQPQPDAMLPDLDERVKRLLGVAVVPSVAALPSPLLPVPRLLFLLRRGPLLSAVLQHEDDIDALRVLFLHASLPTAMRLLQPELYVCVQDAATGAIAFIAAPLEDLMLQSDLVLFLDRHTDIFVWTGRSVSASVATRLQEACLARAAAERSRFPAPQVQFFGEGSSMARWLLCALIPSHKDSREAQMALVPRLAQLDPAVYTQLVAKFHHTDDLVRNHSLAFS